MCLNKELCGIPSTVKTQSLKHLTSYKKAQSKSLKFVNGLKPLYHTQTFSVKQCVAIIGDLTNTSEVFHCNPEVYFEPCQISMIALSFEDR